MLAETLAVHVEIQCLGQRFPFVHALKRDKVLALETFDDLEIVADIIVGEVCRLAVRNGACCGETDVIPVDVCAEGVVDERSLLVQLIDKFAR